MAECPGTFRLSATRDGALARLRIPGGQLSATQLRTVGRLADELGNGLIDLTNRANLQIRGLGGADGPALIAALREAGLIAGTPASDRHRNITAPPLAGLDPDELIDVTPFVRALDKVLQEAPWISRLSPKFAFVFDGGGPNGIGTVAHDLGFFAEPGDEGPIFRISFAGEVSEWCVAPQDCVELAERLAAFAAHQTISESGRMATLTHCLPVASLLQQACAGKDLTVRVPLCKEPQAGTTPCPGIMTQNDPARAAYALGVPLQRLTAETCETLAVLAETYGDATLRLTPWLMVLLPNVHRKRADELRAAAREAGFLTDPQEGRLRIVACAGATGCDRALADTKTDADKLRQELATSADALTRPFTVHLSACTRGCAFAAPADLLLLARGTTSGYEAYADSDPRDPIRQNRLGNALLPAHLAPFVQERMRQRQH